MAIVAYAKTKGNEIKEITLFPPPGFKQIEWMGISLVPHFRLSDSTIKRKMPLLVAALRKPMDPIGNRMGRETQQLLSSCGSSESPQSVKMFLEGLSDFHN